MWELIVDTVGFGCKAFSWSWLILVPILAILIVLWHKFLSAGLSIILVFLVLSHLLSWLGSGVLERKRPRMSILSILCFLFAVLPLIKKPAVEMTTTYIFSLLCGLCGVVLTIAVLRQQRAAK
jgi:hypothetical protein